MQVGAPAPLPPEGRPIFLGAIPQDLRAIVSEQTRSWDTEDVWVGCSGAFTIERVLSDRFQLHSNDVSIYSAAIGHHLAGQPFQVSLKAAYADELGWLTPYLEGQEDALATLLVCSSMFEGLGKENAFYDRIRSGYRTQWKSVHARTVEKLRRLDLSLASFDCGDCREFVAGLPDDAAVCSFPPFYAGGYEAMFQGLDEVFDWPAPSYELMDEQGLADYLGVMQEKRHWLFGTSYRVSGLKRNLRGLVQATSRNVPIFVYASGGTSRVARPRQNIEAVPIPHLSPQGKLGAHLSLSPLRIGQFNMLRSLYLDPGIPPATPLLALGVLCDGRLIGCLAFVRERWGRGIYLMSDFAVAPTRYAKLSKLMLYAALSRECRQLLQRALSSRVHEIKTTAFTKRPTSMKYRGLFRLTARLPEEDGSRYKWRLNYVAHAGQWPLDEGLESWKAKHG